MAPPERSQRVGVQAEGGQRHLHEKASARKSATSARVLRGKRSHQKVVDPRQKEHNHQVGAPSTRESRDDPFPSAAIVWVLRDRRGQGICMRRHGPSKSATIAWVLRGRVGSPKSCRESARGAQPSNGCSESQRELRMAPSKAQPARGCSG